MQEFALSNLSAVDTSNALTTHFGRLSSAQIAQIAETLGLLHSAEQVECAVLMANFVSSYVL